MFIRFIKSRQLGRKICFFKSEPQQFSSEELLKAQKYVEETLRSRTWVTYMLASYLPTEVRIPYYAINLFDMQLTKISQNAREPNLAIGRLQFWKQSLNKIYNGEKPQPEPTSICLHHAIHNNPLTFGYFKRMIGVRAQQISNRGISTMAEMRNMADDSKSTLIALTLELMRIEITNEHMKQVIAYLGQAIGICQYLRRVPYSLRNNRFLLPQEILSKYNLTQKNIWNRVYGKPSQELFDGVLEIAAYAKKLFDSAVKIYEENPSSFAPHAFRAFLKGVQIQYYLQNLQVYNFNIFDQNLNNFSPIKLPYKVYNAAKALKFSIGMQIKK